MSKNNSYQKISRRKFLEISTLATAGVFAGLPTVQASTPTAELVLTNGKIITVDTRDSIVEGVAVRGGKILDTGTVEKISKYIGTGTKVIDLQGKTVTPGLIDSHAHLPVFGQRENGNWVNLQQCATKNEVLSKLKERAKILPKGEWVNAWGIADMTFRFLDRDDLDGVSREHPILATHTSGQWGFANTLALEISGIDKNTPDPPGAEIGRSMMGKPTGLLIHYQALYLVRRMMPQISDKKFEEAILFAQNLYAKEGVTAIHDNFFMVSEINSSNFSGKYLMALSSNKMPLRVKIWPYMPNLQEAQRGITNIFSGKDPAPDSVYRELALLRKENPSLFAEIWGGWKLATDGGGPTALFYQNSGGLPMHKKEELHEMVKLFHETEQQISVHAIGDEAVDLTITAFLNALKSHPRKNHRHRIEHALAPSFTAFDHMAEQGIVICTHPQWIYKWVDNARALQKLNTAGRGVFPLKSYLKNNIAVAFGADPPAFPLYQPQIALWQAVKRTTQAGVRLDSSESITIAQALRMQTMGSAYAGFQEKEIGSLETDKLADMVIWDRDYYTIPADEIKDVKALLTFVGGKVVYEKKAV